MLTSRYLDLTKNWRMIKLMQQIYRRWLTQYRWANTLRELVLLVYFRFLRFVRFFTKKSYLLLDCVSRLSSATSNDYARSKIFLLDNVTVVGHTRFILKMNTAVYDASHPDWSIKDIFTSYYFQEEIGKLIRFEPHRGRCHFFDLKAPTRLSGTWMSVMSASSENWMHWMSESMPRLAIALDTMKNSTFGLLVDQKLPKNMRDVLDIFAADIPHFDVAQHDAVEVPQLIVPVSSVAISAFWPRKSLSDESVLRPDQTTIHFRTTGVFHFDVRGLSLVRKVMQIYFDCQPRRARKIFILRRSYFRHIANQERIQMLLRARGFEIITPGEMSVGEQVRIFSEASIVVAQAGASLANIMFMPEGGKVICLAVKNTEYVNYAYFQEYAKIFSVSLEYVLGEVDDPSKYNAAHIGLITHPTNAEFSCPENELLEMLDRLQLQTDSAYV